MVEQIIPRKPVFKVRKVDPTKKIDPDKKKDPSNKTVEKDTPKK
jgi:hypothetical protein